MAKKKKKKTVSDPYAALAKRKPVSTRDLGPDNERVRRVFAMFTDGHKTIRDARLRLTEKKDGATLSTLDYIEAKMLDLGAELKKVEAKNMAFLTGQAGIRPPTQTELEKARRIAKNLDADIAANLKVKAIVSTATEALRLFHTAIAADDLDPDTA